MFFFIVLAPCVSDMSLILWNATEHANMTICDQNINLASNTGGPIVVIFYIVDRHN